MIELNNKKKLTIAISVYCSLLLAIVLIGQHETVLNVINSILSVLSPLIIGFTVAYLLNPILKFFEKKVFKFIKNKRILRFVGVFFTYISLILFFLALGMLVIPQVTKSITELVSKFESYKESALDFVNSILQNLKNMNILSNQVDANSIIEMLSDDITSGASIMKSIVSFLAANIDEILVIPKNILLGLFISIYALLNKERLAAQFKKLAKAVLSAESYETVYHRVTFTQATFGGYFTGVLLDALFVGITAFLALVIFGIPYASLIAVVVAVTNVIPVFGPFIGAIPSAIIIFISQPNKVLLFIILMVVIQQIDGNIIAPKILGNSTGMSSLSVIIAISIMGSCFGFIGMFIGVPVFAVIIALIKELVDERLMVKELPTETSHYYYRNSMADVNQEHITLFERICKLFKFASKKSPKQEDDE